jgi:acetyl-CoA carboxylase biotin carboxyl carrier protein
MAIHKIIALLPGTFSRRPSPDQPYYVEPGGRVQEGDTIGLIEVMKSFNSVVADKSGTLVRYLVEDDDDVMAGDALCEIDV